MRKNLIITLLAVISTVIATHAQLVQHLDADIEGSIIKDESNLISTWNDQSDKGNNAVAGASGVYYYKNDEEENAWVDLGEQGNSLQLFSAEASDSWLDQSSGTGGFCVLIAFKINAIIDNWNDILGNSSVVSQGLGLRYGSSGNIQAYLGGKSINKNGINLTGGDKVVFAFNYNATTGSYELWDSKNGNAVTGSISNKDFSLESPVTLGTTTMSGRFFNGLVGEIKVYDNFLSAQELKAERDAMSLKWLDVEVPIVLNWSVISEDANFPTEDLVLAALSVSSEQLNNPLPSDPANNDCTSTFQEALDFVGSNGGGTVFVPEGHYRLNGRLTVPRNVTLRGRWRAISESAPAIGSILKVYDGRGEASGSPFIIIEGSGGVRDLAFWHPEQDPENIVAYPFVIEPDGGPITIENITLINAYQGVNMSYASMCFLDNIQGTALKTGLFADKSYAVSRFDKVYISPAFWEWSKLELDLNNAYKTYMMSNGIGIDIREMDGYHLTDSKVRGMNIGLQLDVGVTGDNPWGDNGGMDIRNCNVALQINSCKTVFFANSYFEGINYGLLNRYNKDHLPMNNCTFIGGIAAVDNQIGGNLNLSSCVFEGKVLGSGDMQITGCEFKNSGTDIEFDNKTVSALVFGCTYADGPDIKNNAPASASVAIDNDGVNTYSSCPLLPPKDMSIVRKPAKNDIFNIADYGALPDDGIDDSDALKQAIDAANANNGGIVLVPHGDYDVAGNYTLMSGVELRGVNGSRQNPQKNPAGSMLRITGNDNDPTGQAFLTLEAHTGIRGLVFFYPDQKVDMILPETIIEYPFTVRGSGDGIYIADCMFANPYQAINFVEADHHLVENCLLGGLNKTLLIENCNSGRVGEFHLKPDFWRDLARGDHPTTGDGTSMLKRYVGKYLHGIWLKNCTNQVVYNIFNHASHQFMRVDNSTGLGYMIAGEQLQRGYRFSGSKDFSLVLSNAFINNHGDWTGSIGQWADENYTGTVKTWLCEVGGPPDNAFVVESGEIFTQQGSVGGAFPRGAIGFQVEKNGVLKLNAFSFDRVFNFNFAPGSQVSIQESQFDADLPNALLHDPVAVLERSVFLNSYALTDVNQDSVINQGLVLNESNIVIQEAKMVPGYSIYDARANKSARTTNGKFNINVSDKDFLYGSNMPFDVSVFFLMDTDCKVDIYYNSSSGRKLGRSFTYNQKAEPKYLYSKLTLNDAYFTGEEDISIEITGDSPMLNFVTLSRQIKVINRAPVWSADTISFDEAVATVAYDKDISIGTDVVDPENDALSFSKISGPEWLSFNSSGKLSGTPAISDGGINSFIVQANDGNGNRANVTLQIIVKDVTGSSLILRGNISAYPVPTNDRLIIKGINEKFSYQIFNMSGSKILEGETANNTISTKGLISGSYILKIDEHVIRIVKL